MALTVPVKSSNPIVLLPPSATERPAIDICVFPTLPHSGEPSDLSNTLPLGSALIPYPASPVALPNDINALPPASKLKATIGALLGPTSLMVLGELAVRIISWLAVILILPSNDLISRLPVSMDCINVLPSRNSRRPVSRT